MSPVIDNNPRFQDYPLYVADVAKLLDFHPQYVRYMAKKGAIPAVKIGGQWRFSEKELRESLISSENSPRVKLKTEAVADTDDLLS